MSWFIFSLVAVLGWGFADLFYKKGTDENDRYSHLKIAVWVGLVMGVVSLALLFILPSFTNESFTPGELAIDALKYSPAAIGYIVSMVIGYAGLRYLEVSIVSPVQNASGALSAIALIIYFLIFGKTNSLLGDFSALNMIGTAVIVAGVILLGIAESRISSEESKTDEKEFKKHRMGALALIFPLLYCLFDTIGTTADGIILEGENGLGLSEMTVLILYGLIFALAAVCAYVFLIIKEKKAYNPFAPAELKTKGVAAVFEEFGQIFYVYAMASKPYLAAPVISAYCIVSVILSKLVLKEKLKPLQNIAVVIVIAGIILLGIQAGFDEM